VNTGLMSQVIQGNNLRLLFADTPPSTSNAGTMYNPYQGGYGYTPYGHPGHSPSNSSGGRPSYSGYGPPPHVPFANHYVRTAGRDEILIVSDDRVLTLRTSQPLASDSASMASMPR
jgi:hypothetical protein